MILPKIVTENTIVADADLSTAVAGFNDDNYMATASNSAIEKFNQRSVSWRDEILSKRQQRKSNEKL